MLYRELARMDPLSSVQAATSEDSSAAGCQTADGANQAQPNGSNADDMQLLMPYDVTNEVSAGSRIELYRSKPCLFVTTRILVVDMLNARIQGQHIAGMVIMNAHRVTDSSGEAIQNGKQTWLCESLYRSAHWLCVGVQQGTRCHSMLRRLPCSAISTRLCMTHKCLRMSCKYVFHLLLFFLSYCSFLPCMFEECFHSSRCLTASSRRGLA